MAVFQGQLYGLPKGTPCMLMFTTKDIMGWPFTGNLSLSLSLWHWKHTINGWILYIYIYIYIYYGYYRHGVKNPRNPWSDGPEYVTQCPIQPGSNFTYEVIFSDEEGTIWWHAHSEWTRASVHGAIVVLPVNGTTRPFPEPDEEEILVLGMLYIYIIFFEGC